MNDRLYRSVDDRVIAGVCGGLAVRMGIDPSLVRIGYAVVAFVTGIFPLLVLYVIMAAVVPEEPTGFAGAGRPPAPPGPDAVPGWTPPGGGDASAPGVAGMPGVPDAGAPASSVPGEAPGWAGAPGVQRAPRERRGDPLVGVIGGLVLVGLGTWFLVRDRVDIDWGIVWAAGLMAVGVVVVVAAFVRPRR
jgi:phage shock protein C